MARMVKEEEYALKRNEILDSAQRLVYTKGYERMTIQDILVDLKISNGAFYHYFDSKPAVLEALIERMQQEAEQPLLSIVHDPHLPALEKLQRYFATLDRSRITQKAFIADLARVWLADDNAIVREKVDAAIVERRAPLLNEIVRQGIREGVFTFAYPDQAGEIILSLQHGMGNTLVRLMLLLEQQRDHLRREDPHRKDPRTIHEIVATCAAYAAAIERVLGAPDRFLYRPDVEVIREWLDVNDAMAR
jgi:AcrR family transcriptional regulator